MYAHMTPKPPVYMYVGTWMTDPHENVSKACYRNRLLKWVTALRKYVAMWWSNIMVPALKYLSDFDH